MTEPLALALGIALSPFPVVPAILLLFTARPRPTSLTFLAGWATGVASATVVFVLLSDLVGSTGASPRWLSWVRVVLGAVLVGYGIRQWLSRHRSDEPPAWMQSLEDATPSRALRLSLVLSAANPKILLLAAAGGLDIGSAGLTAVGQAAAVLAFAVVASLGVAVPVLGYAVVGDRLLPPLQRAKDWLLRNNSAVMAVVIAVIGLVLLKNGLTAL